jgi:hypothetical protein
VYSPEPGTKSTAAAVAGVSTAVGFVADIVEQAARPDVGKMAQNFFISYAQNRIDQKLPLIAPLTNEVRNLWQQSGSGLQFETWVNQEWQKTLKQVGGK